MPLKLNYASCSEKKDCVKESPKCDVQSLFKDVSSQESLCISSSSKKLK